MKTNIGSIDGMVRIVVGFALLALVLMLDGNARWFGLVGIVPIATGLLRVCPLYTLLGLSTCYTEPRRVQWQNESPRWR